MEKELFASDELKKGQKKAVQVGLNSILVCNVDGKFYAVDNLCSHLKVPLALGHLDGDIITCRAHGARFEVTTGKMLDGPANEKWKDQSLINRLAAPVIPSLFAGSIRTYPIRENSGLIFITVPD